MNRYDRLLEWASEIGAGSWASWRGTCSYLGVPASSAARKLAALGHIEFDWISNRFAVKWGCASIPHIGTTGAFFTTCRSEAQPR